MHYINRSVAIVSTRQAFVDWLNKTSGTKDFSLASCNRNRTALLLPDFDDERHARRFITESWADILRHQVVMRLGDQSRMPAEADYTLFCDWFNWELSGDVYDMAEDEIEKELI